MKAEVKSSLRDGLDILLVVAFVVLVPASLERLLATSGIDVAGVNRILVTGAIFVVLTLFAILLLRLRGQRPASIGLRRPESWARTVLLGAGLAAVLFAIIVLAERLYGVGEGRLGDLATELRSNLPMALLRMGLSVLVVGFVEEFIFRGFFMDRLAGMFGRGRAAWTVALLLQAALFGLSHAYQGTEGMILTAVAGVLLGGVFLSAGRNLWPVILAHAFYDGARALYFYAILT